MSLKQFDRRPGLRKSQQGALIIVTLLILLITSMLGMGTMDTTGIEMQMSSNSRGQQQAFEAAEYTLSWVESNLNDTGYFRDDSLLNKTTGTPPLCGSVCFSNACTNGYCFAGNSVNATNVTSCNTVPSPSTAPEFYTVAANWANGSGKYRTLSIPGTSITAKYIIEFMCYTVRDISTGTTVNAGNNAKMYRITAYVVAEDGRSRAMLRSLIKQI